MDKQKTLDEVEAGFKELLAAVEGLDERAMSVRFYGSWNVKDILAHIAGWQHTMTGALERMGRGERPTPEGVDYSDADAWNAKFAAAMTAQNAATVVADLRQSFANYVRAARALPDDRYGEGKTVNRLLETSGTGHYKEHLPAIREFVAKARAA
ncbi:MAG TPA: maleylpyruvate isomerase N-terminal domain-containing protein [Dehalococcoidia bacterium]|nr:maleylpyruvate isomerase N-terminal domain-containing protein [Dehalococcoidia bacterium]